MERETRVAYGPAPRRLLDGPIAETCWQMLDDQFLFRAAGEHYFHYRKGSGITIERGPDVDPADESLWLNGSVYAAVASLNELVPIHASAVAENGSVFAFTGAPGAGKSTLVAALGDRGLAMFCDDTLVLDLSDPERVICLPGHKRLKLTPGALAMTKAAREEQVAPTLEKFYSTPASGTAVAAMPLAELIFLEAGAQTAIDPIAGFERFARMQDEHYTAELYAGAQVSSAARRFEHLAQLASRLTLSRFVRPLGEARFDEDADFIGAYVRRGGAAVRSGSPSSKGSGD
jgi:hypothetical protein